MILRNNYLHIFSCKEQFLTQKIPHSPRILQLLEAGIAEKWIMDMIQKNQHRGLYDNKDDEDGGNSDESTLGIDDVQGAFAALVIGQILGIICCIAENYIAW